MVWCFGSPLIQAAERCKKPYEKRNVKKTILYLGFYKKTFTFVSIPLQFYRKKKIKIMI